HPNIAAIYSLEEFAGQHFLHHSLNRLASSHPMDIGSRTTRMNQDYLKSLFSRSPTRPANGQSRQQAAPCRGGVETTRNYISSPRMENSWPHASTFRHPVSRRKRLSPCFSRKLIRSSIASSMPFRGWPFTTE